ncbi:hypothetical protein GQ607_009605 [Colletotrichum asianum]|nr:hypothetical protein GQ607_009605 [Colletotrichum asianum]
MYIYIS